ncbi:hypothetical protein [Streptomyces sp. NPDC001502]|uniref:hypothetical protein n=1 Tax=Streptomyces sp. NPDC001502 TaxID=3364578 RepID=UPI00367A548F
MRRTPMSTARDVAPEAGALLSALPRGGFGAARRRTLTFLAVLLGQGLVGLVQSVTALPSLLVMLHLLGSALVWTGALQVHLTVRRDHFSDSGPLGGAPPPRPAPMAPTPSRHA